MSIKEIIKKLEKPTLYEKGTHVMWTDEHISKQLLIAHLDPDVNAASRSEENIERTIKWLGNFKKSPSKVLDLGCGPGLYCEQLAKRGYDVTGIDWSKNSIDYAKIAYKDLNIKFVCDNYLEHEFKEKYDLIIMIFCDLGVLSITDRKKLLSKIYNNLKDDGVFIFDVRNENYLDVKTLEKTWEFDTDNFWSEKPHICLSQSIHYPENKVILDQHLVFEDDFQYKIYRFWEHYFSNVDIEKELTNIGFKDIENYQDVVLNSNDITFYKVIKNK